LDTLDLVPPATGDGHIVIMRVGSKKMSDKNALNRLLQATGVLGFFKVGCSNQKGNFGRPG